MATYYVDWKGGTGSAAGRHRLSQRDILKVGKRDGVCLRVSGGHTEYSLAHPK